MNEDEFKKKLRKYFEEGGHGYDEYDLSANWRHYQQDPKAFEFLNEV